MREETKQQLEIIAGPCSISLDSAREIINDIAPIQTRQKTRAIYGTRVVGLKSRTGLDSLGEGMGIDCSGVQAILRGGNMKTKDIVLPSVLIATEIVKKTGMHVATEIMLPELQLPFYAEQRILDDRLLIWNPSVNQLGWHIATMAGFARNYGWKLGIKNGKFLGDVHLSFANHPEFPGVTTLEKTWTGLLSYANDITTTPILIHRGVDVPGRGDFRNAPVHEVVKRIKANTPGVKIYFDPSHSFGPKLRDKIVSGTVAAMKISVGQEFLYDGILIETGTSSTDTDEHITISELKDLVDKLSSFRKLKSPETEMPNVLQAESID